jgi:hypothetical protein
MEDQKTIFLKLDGKDNELTVRTGDAPKVNNPVKVSFSGNIKAPANYASNDENIPDKQTAVVVVNASEGTLSYDADPSDELAAKITGKLLVNPDLAKFGINENKKYSPKDLGTLIKRNRIFFTDKDGNAKLVTELNDFSGKVETELVKSQDTSGNSHASVVRKVSTNVPRGFHLFMPIYVGYEPKNFPVEVCLESNGSGVDCYLESPELNDLMATEKEAAINAELLRFKTLVNVVIEK